VSSCSPAKRIGFAGAFAPSCDPEWSYGYEPFGTALLESHDGANAPANPMRFAGEQLDTDTGLYHLRARQYDPATGRFLATDLIPQSPLEPYVGAYVYALDLPTTIIDPSGLLCLSFHCGWNNTKAAARAAGRTVVNVATNPTSGIAVGGAGAGCLIFIEAGPVAAVCEVAVAVGPVLDVAASARKNLFGPCKDVTAFVGDAAFAGASIGAGPALKGTWEEILDKEHSKIAKRLTDPAIWAAGVARQVDEHSGCNTK